MSGNLIESLSDPVIYPHWMWVLGVAILLAVIGWVVYNLWAWLHSRQGAVAHLQTISQARRARYHDFLSQIGERRACGELDERGTHLAVAGLMRALGTERSGRDLEVATVSEIRALVPTWPQLAGVLEACETPSFIGDESDGGSEQPPLPGGEHRGGGLTGSAPRGIGGTDILVLASQAVDA